MKDELTEAARIFFGNATYSLNGTPMPEIQEHFEKQAVRFAANEVRRRELEIAGHLRKIYRENGNETIWLALDGYADGLEAQGKE